MRHEGTGIICQEESFSVSGFYTWEENTVSEPKIQPNQQSKINHMQHILCPASDCFPSFKMHQQSEGRNLISP